MAACIKALTRVREVDAIADLFEQRQADRFGELLDLHRGGRLGDVKCPEERKKIDILTRSGDDRDSVHSVDVPYNDLLPEMFKINVGYFLIQLSSERDREFVYQSIGQHSRGACPLVKGGF